MKIATILIGLAFLLKLIKIVYLIKKIGYKKRKSDYKLDLQYNKNLFRSKQ